MHNPGQTWILYKPGQTHLTQTKCDPVDLDNPDDPTRFQPWAGGTAFKGYRVFLL